MLLFQQQPLLILGENQREGFPGEQGSRMRREGDDNGMAAGGSRTVGQSTEHFAVRQMQTVEHAQTYH